MLVSNAPIAVPVSTANPPTELAQAEAVKKVPIPEPKSTVENPANRQLADAYQESDKPNSTKQSDESNQKQSLSDKNSEDAESSEKEEQRRELIEQQQVQKLKKRDSEVKAHEQAHAAVGGELAGAPQYQYTLGPDGKRYAIAGEVKIDISPEQDPQQTITKMEKVKRAALAPVEPSAQDLKVAAQAGQVANQALADLAAQKSQAVKFEQAEKKQTNEENNGVVDPADAGRVSDTLNQKITNTGALGILKKPSSLSVVA